MNFLKYRTGNVTRIYRIPLITGLWLLLPLLLVPSVVPNHGTGTDTDTDK